jgi:hypothetical protein
VGNSGPFEMSRRHKTDLGAGGSVPTAISECGAVDIDRASDGSLAEATQRSQCADAKAVAMGEEWMRRLYDWPQIGGGVIVNETTRSVRLSLWNFFVVRTAASLPCLKNRPSHPDASRCVCEQGCYLLLISSLRLQRTSLRWICAPQGTSLLRFFLPALAPRSVAVAFFLLPSRTADITPLDRVHVPIAPNLNSSQRTSEPSASMSPDPAQYRYVSIPDETCVLIGQESYPTCSALDTKQVRRVRCRTTKSRFPVLLNSFAYLASI